MTGRLFLSSRGGAGILASISARILLAIAVTVIIFIGLMPWWAISGAAVAWIGFEWGRAYRQGLKAHEEALRQRAEHERDRR
jgi:hypothetical protein